MRLTLAILTLNELKGLEQVFREIPRSAVDEVFAVDGGSTDGTVEFLQRNGVRVIGQEVKGRGEAFRVAFRESRCEAILFFSPDGNEDPKDILKFKPLLDQGYDLVIATRMVSGARNEEDGEILPLRKWANLGFTWLANTMWNRGSYVTDTINGFRAITKRAWSILSPDGPGYTIEYQSSIRAFKAGLRIAEFPTHEAKRIDERPGSPSIQTGLAFLKLFLKEVCAGSKVSSRGE